MKVKTDLPDSIRGFAYVKNSHYIELEDEDGNIHRLLPNSLINYKCTDCEFEFFSKSNFGLRRCPVCGGEVKAIWGNVQLCFIPEKESNFKHQILKKEDKRDGTRS